MYRLLKRSYHVHTYHVHTYYRPPDVLGPACSYTQPPHPSASASKHAGAFNYGLGASASFYSKGASARVYGAGGNTMPDPLPLLYGLYEGAGADR